MPNNEIKHTTINGVFEWLDENIADGCSLYDAAHSYIESEKAKSEKHDGPFLTVITRTQGKRVEMLRESLLCLSGQSDEDFELLVMGHNIEDENEAKVKEIIEDLPDSIRSRTRYIKVIGGTRATPLNKGFEVARGEYVAIYDDDDIVFDNWVEEFHSLCMKEPGKILHSYSLLQDWEIVGGIERSIPRAADAPESIYCEDFNLYRQLGVNLCPLMSLAFPIYAFREYGIHFDNSLNTTEDWDFLMRTALMTGVANSSQVTSIYRNWINAENSKIAHKKEEWDKNYRKIVDRFSTIPIISLNCNIASVFNVKGNFGHSAFRNTLYLGYDTGFSEENSIIGEKNTEYGSDYSICFDVVNFNSGIRLLRFDPDDFGGFYINDIKIKFVTKDGKEFEFTQSDVTTNGYVTKNGFLYLKSDPQFILNIPNNCDLSKVYLEYKLDRNIDDATVNNIIYGHNLSKIYHNIIRKIMSILRGIKHAFK